MAFSSIASRRRRKVGPVPGQGAKITLLFPPNLSIIVLMNRRVAPIPLPPRSGRQTARSSGSFRRPSPLITKPHQESRASYGPISRYTSAHGPQTFYLGSLFRDRVQKYQNEIIKGKLTGLAYLDTARISPTHEDNDRMIKDYVAAVGQAASRTISFMNGMLHFNGHLPDGKTIVHGMAYYNLATDTVEHLYGYGSYK